MAIHLTVLNNGENRAPAYSPARHDFRWIANYAAYQPLALKWWDDASYLAYQSGVDFDEEPSDDANEAAPVAVVEAQDEDCIPF